MGKLGVEGSFDVLLEEFAEKLFFRVFFESFGGRTVVLVVLFRELVVLGLDIGDVF